MFNQVLAMGDRPTYQLTDVGGEGTYDVEDDLVATHGVNSIAGYLILLTISGERKAASTSGYAVDCAGLHDDAEIVINIGAAGEINAIGGAGGIGGGGDIYVDDPFGSPQTFSTVNAGTAGKDGGDALNMGCKTTIKGSGIIRGGNGGGGGGTPIVSIGNNAVDGGGGGGGGTPYGLGGVVKICTNTAPGGTADAGTAGTNATKTAKGTGGVGSFPGTPGGNGGEFGSAPVQSFPQAPGVNGNAIIKNGHELVKIGSVTYEGNEAA